MTSASPLLLLTAVGDVLLLVGIVVTVWLSRRQGDHRASAERAGHALTRRREVLIVRVVLGGLAVLVLWACRRR